MGYSASHQPAAKNSGTDSIFGVMLVQAAFGAVCPGFDQLWDGIEAADEIYTDRHSSSVKKSQPQALNRTNGKFELGVKNSLNNHFGQQTRPRPDVDLETPLPYWLRDFCPRRGRALAYAA